VDDILSKINPTINSINTRQTRKGIMDLNHYLEKMNTITTFIEIL
jgi:hypothetical protein